MSDIIIMGFFTAYLKGRLEQPATVHKWKQALMTLD